MTPPWVNIWHLKKCKDLFIWCCKIHRFFATQTANRWMEQPCLGCKKKTGRPSCLLALLWPATNGSWASKREILMGLMVWIGMKDEGSHKPGWRNITNQGITYTSSNPPFRVMSGDVAIHPGVPVACFPTSSMCRSEPACEIHPGNFGMAFSSA